jgi:hypothetical protein
VPGQPIFLDTPEANPAAIELAKTAWYGAGVRDCTHVYKGKWCERAKPAKPSPKN